MKKRNLFVFAGQSNMMGAAVYPATDIFEHRDSFEYKYAPKMYGESEGFFSSHSHPCGEFIYADEQIEIAKTDRDENGKSRLNKYSQNCYFCPAMANILSDENKTTQPFDNFSQSSFQVGATLAPLLIREWEKLGQSCAYTHITKGGVSISHFFSDAMVKDYEQRIIKYNSLHNSNISPNTRHTPMCDGAARAFDKKVMSFFEEAKIRFSGEDTSIKALIWCQGENDAIYNDNKENYRLKLEVFWEHLKGLGFTHMFFIRIGFWEGLDTRQIMQAQEEFCREQLDCHMLTRVMSFMPFEGMDEGKYYLSAPADEYRYCRDSYYGFDNLHINQKGFQVVANHAIKNLKAVLLDKAEPTLEDELVRFE